MTTFNTGNPVPSADARDLSDNAETIDEIVNSAAQTVTSRTGKGLSTIKNLEAQYTFTAINNGVWAAGQTFTAVNQFMVFTGTAYKPRNSTTLPYVVGATPVGDANVEVVGNLSTAQGDDRYLREFDDLAGAIAAIDLIDGQSIILKERTTGSGGGSIWGVVLLSTVTPNGDNIFASTGGQIPALALVLREGYLYSRLHFSSISDVLIAKQATGEIAKYKAGQLLTVKSVFNTVDIYEVTVTDSDLDLGSSLFAKKLESDSIAALQSKNISAYSEKVQRDSAAIIIACRGDSLTYGEDTTVDPQAADPVNTPDGRSHTATRASDPYPQTLQTQLQEVFTSTVTVINQGFSGDNTLIGWGDWDVDVSSDLTLIMYGTNDAAEGFSPFQSIEDFIFFYKMIIYRELRRGAAVALITPPVQKQLNANTRLLEAYRQAVFNMGKEYAIPVLDGAEIFQNVDSTLFSDNVHFRSDGYKFLSAKVFSFILSKFNNYASVKSGTNIGVRFAENGIKARFANWGTQLAKADQNSPPLSSFSGGYVIETSALNEPFVFCFYAEQDDLIIIPNINIENAQVTIELNDSLPQLQFTFDDRVSEITAGVRTAKPVSVKTVTAVDSEIFIDRLSPFTAINAASIHIATKGWYNLKFTIQDNGSAGTERLTIAGLNFMDYETFTVWNERILDRISAAQTPIGNVTPDFIGQEYFDSSGGQFNFYKATGLTSANWKIIT